MKDKVIDILKVDKGQLILLIDCEQRIKIEEKNILTSEKLQNTEK